MEINQSSLIKAIINCVCLSCIDCNAVWVTATLISGVVRMSHGKGDSGSILRVTRLTLWCDPVEGVAPWQYVYVMFFDDRGQEVSLFCRFYFTPVCDNLVLFDSDICSMSTLPHVLPHQSQTVCFSLHLCISTPARQLLPPTYRTLLLNKLLNTTPHRSQQYWLITCVRGFMLLSHNEIEFPMVRKVIVHHDHPRYPVSLNK